MTENRRPNRFLSVICCISAALFILSLSISVPILFRPLYYYEIDRLGLPDKTGYTYEVIKEAYDDMMDFCVNGEEFGTGQLKWSEEGMSHFADCRKLFILDFAVCAVSGAVLLCCIIISVMSRIPLKRQGRRGPLFFAPLVLISVIAVIAVFFIADFENAFTVFHTVFFPGKTNWIFDPRYDEIIRILPAEVFADFGVTIAVSAAVLSGISIAADFLTGRKKAQ